MATFLNIPLMLPSYLVPHRGSRVVKGMRIIRNFLFIETVLLFIAFCIPCCHARRGDVIDRETNVCSRGLYSPHLLVGNTAKTRSMNEILTLFARGNFVGVIVYQKFVIVRDFASDLHNTSPWRNNEPFASFT